ncbi:hypothetical protein CAPTEDRAFT_177636 [Capitella teleta]|uniref:Major facilitator superfamily (MFS) profile domain-containing protein n=2 Tax=Capitella teleta TaxID=283909 RepID=R7U5N9_CAPTE|nr:hypothetical protein CAPTEDRAFT_177636 [Capitella teleta]|eukprot:ELT98460.1 hypothetical protein CAPTEDRAFT_177636 [Capitella teleta]
MTKSKRIVPDQGWSWLVLFAAFLSNVTFDGVIFSFGVFYVEFLGYFNAGRAQTSWIGSVISAVYAVVGPLASVLCNKFGSRAVTIMGSLIASSGFILSTFSTNMTMMILTYGVLGGIGFGLMYLCCYVMVGNYFEKYRAMATGVASCGSGVGTFIFAPLSLLLIESYGWKGAMWIIAGLVLNGVVIGLVFRPLPSPSEEDVGKEKSKKSLCDFSLLRKPAFLVFGISSFLCMIGFFVPFIYLPDYAKQLGIGPGKSAILLSVIGIFNTSGRIMCGFLSDKSWVDSLKIYNSALIIGGAMTMGCSFINSFAMLLIYAAVFGVCIASYVSLCVIILIEILGLERLSSSFGFLNMFRGVATILGAPLAGFLYDVTGTYDLAFYVAGASIATAGLICLPLRMLSQCTDTKDLVDLAEKQSDLPANKPLQLQQCELTQSMISLTGSSIMIQSSHSMALKH